ncbi:hypothetical protein Tco_1125376 [Tanacetum coccineum]|uniref:Uncharacterized protein n=1 Tax=Tanacetum coccineum TaxID=301880 RepID=A0ABQ5JA02_9ASTR
MSSLDHIEEMKAHVDGRVIIQQDFDKLKTELQEARAQIAGLQRKRMGRLWIAGSIGTSSEPSVDQESVFQCSSESVYVLHLKQQDKGPQGRPKPEKAWGLQMTGNKDQLDDFERIQLGSRKYLDGVAKPYITGKGRNKSWNVVRITFKILNKTCEGKPLKVLPSKVQEHPDVASTSTIILHNFHTNPTSLPPEQSPPPIPTPIPASTPTPIPETDPEPMEHTFEEPSPAHQHFSPPQELAQGQMTLDDLLQLEEPEDQGRKSQDDPLVSLVQGLVTPSKTTVMLKGKEQLEEPKPNNIKNQLKLSPGLLLKIKSPIDKGRRYKRRKETKGKKVVTSLDFQEEVSTGAEGVNTAKGVNTGSIKVSTVSGQVSTNSINKSIHSPDKGQREEKASMIIEEAPKKTKEQILQEEASLAEAIKLDTLEKEEEAKQVHLDSLLAQRIVKEEELNEQQKQRRAQVQFEAQHYTDEDWDLIRAKIEANAKLSKGSARKWLTRRRLCKKDATKDSLKRFGEELQTKTSKRLKSDEAKDDESTKKTGKRRKQIARKGLHFSPPPFDKTDEDESKDSKDDDPISGTNIPINPVPVAIKPPSIATYKIIKQGEKGVYQIVREDGTDIVKYPLTAEVCKAMLDKKLQGGKPDEDCYKLLKWMEKQAGIRK